MVDDLKIVGVDAVRVAIPVEAPILTCYGALSMFTRTLIYLRTDIGITGLGEVPGNVAPEQVRAFGESITGWSPWETNRIRARLVDSHYYHPPWLLVAGFEMACLDALGKHVGKPVYDLLGGAIRKTVPASEYLFFRNADKHGDGSIKTSRGMVAAAREWKERFGFDAIKLKGGYTTPKIDVETLTLLAAEFGANTKLRIDPQGAWSLQTAMQVGRDIKDLPMEYWEDPVWGMAGCSELRKRFDLPLATNMCVTRFDDLAGATQLRPVDVILSDIWYWGGIANTMALDVVAGPLGFSLGMHSGCEMGVGLAAMLHTAASMKSLKCDIDVLNYHLTDDIISERLLPSQGSLAVPSGPGLGVSLDEGKVKEYARLASDASENRILSPARPDPERPDWFACQPSW